MHGLTPDALVYDVSTAAEPAVSPDGRRVLYSVARADRARDLNTRQIWVADLASGTHRQVTRTGDRNRGARWAPGGDRIAFVSDRAPRSAVFVCEVDAVGDPREIVRHDAEISDLAWAPHGGAIAYCARQPLDADAASPTANAPRTTARIDYKRDSQGYLGDDRRHIFVVDLANGSRRRLTRGALDRAAPAWSPDGLWIATQVATAGVITSQLEIIRVDTGDARRLGEEDGAIATWAWAPDSQSLLFSSDPDRSGQTEFFLHNLASGATRRITTDLAILPNGGFPALIPPAQPLWLDENRVLFAAARNARSGLYVLDVMTGTVAEEEIAATQRNDFSADRTGTLVAQTEASPEALGEIVLRDRRTGASRALTNLSRPLVGGAGLTWERVETTHAGYAIEGWILKPPGFSPATRYPLVMDIHGGPQAFYGYGFTTVQLALAAAGFVTLFCNPRGSTSYGRAFTSAVFNDWGGHDYGDLMAMVDHVAARPYIDHHRLGVFGYSYGGYMTSWIIGQTDRFRAAVCGAPCFNLTSMYGSSDIGHSFGAHHWGGPPHANRDWYLARSPSTHAHCATTPTLIVHGESDDRCPIGQGEEMYTALKVAGCEVEFVRYPGGSHLFQRIGPPSHRADYLTRVVGWFEKWLVDSGQ